MKQLLEPSTYWTLLCAACLAVMVLPVQACNAQQMPNKALTDTIRDLKSKASDRPVRVIVKVRPAASEDASSAEDVKAELTNVMRNAGTAQVESIEGQPLLVMELSADQLDHLLASGLVQSVQEDKAEGLY